MPIIASGKGDYTPAPTGFHKAVLCDVVDRGMQKSQYGEKHSIQLVWEIASYREDGNPHRVSKFYTLSVHPKSKLGQDLAGWFGRDLTDEERSGFDLEELIGKNAQVQVVHKKSADGTKTFANVTIVAPAGEGQELEVSDDYTRVCDRVEEPEDEVPF